MSGKAIEMRRAYLAIAGAAKRPAALVVGEDEDDVWVAGVTTCHV